MPVVEKYGLMVLFGLCAVIVGVGIFAEDPLTEQALQQNQQPVAKVESSALNDPGSSPLDDSQGGGVQQDPFPGDFRQEDPHPGLNSYGRDPQKDRSQSLDPNRDESIPRVSGRQSILEEPRQVKPRVVAGPKPALQYREYRVRKGDSLSLIAEKQLGSKNYTDEIRRANPQIKGDKIITGKTIQIPILGGSKRANVARKESSSKNKSRKGHYIRVKKGQSLITIARREYGDENKWKALARRNGIKNPKDLKARQRLFIPSEL